MHDFLLYEEKIWRRNKIDMTDWYRENKEFASKCRKEYEENRRKEQLNRYEKRLKELMRTVGNVEEKERLVKNIEEIKMLSITETDILRAKDYPIERLVEINGFNKFICPFHNDKNPSMHYYKETNSCYCFSCNTHADAIDIYRKIKNCSFKKAVLDLTKFTYML